MSHLYDLSLTAICSLGIGVALALEAPKPESVCIPEPAAYEAPRPEPQAELRHAFDQQQSCWEALAAGRRLGKECT